MLTHTATTARSITALGVIGLGLSTLAACKKMESVVSDKNPPPSAVPVAETAAPAPPPPGAVIKTKKTMAEALEFAAPMMVDKFDESNDGTIVFAIWAAKNLRWQDVAVAKDETSFARVQKDVIAERRKRLCTRGVIIQINTNRTDDGPIYSGLLMNDAENLYHFAAVRSSGDLVQHSPARFCGVVTGRYDYKNSGGGTGHAVDMVGIFDLPENRKAQ